jgi:hypothetical protein
LFQHRLGLGIYFSFLFCSLTNRFFFLYRLQALLTVGTGREGRGGDDGRQRGFEMQTRLEPPVRILVFYFLFLLLTITVYT